MRDVLRGLRRRLRWPAAGHAPPTPLRRRWLRRAERPRRGSAGVACDAKLNRYTISHVRRLPRFGFPAGFGAYVWPLRHFGPGRMLVGFAALAVVARRRQQGCVTRHRRGEGGREVGILRKWTDPAISRFLCRRGRRAAENAGLAEPGLAWSAYHAAHPVDIARMAALASRYVEAGDFDNLSRCLEPYARFEADLEAAALARRVAAELASQPLVVASAGSLAAS
jgi:hypothetical protein